MAPVKREAQDAVREAHRRLAAERSAEVREAFAAWHASHERLHGPLERRRPIDRGALGRTIGAPPASVEPAFALWCVEMVCAAALAHVADAAPSDATRPAPPFALAPLEVLGGDGRRSVDALGRALVAAKGADPFCDVYRGMLHHMVPRQARHALGAFFTPRWLAARAIAASGAGLDARVADPTCGSGVFLLELCRRLAEAVTRGALSAAEAQALGTDTIAGQEINPLSAYAARVNLLWAAPVGGPVVVTGDVLQDRTALLAGGRFDAVVGNPPWVNWEHLPPAYRDDIAHLWPRLGLFDHRGRAKAFSKEDVSVLFAYVALRDLVAQRGVLAFLLPASVFKSTLNARGFRRFRLGAEGDSLEVLAVEELERINAFDGASGTPALTVIRRGSPTRFPVPYRIARRAAGGIETTDRVAAPAAPEDPQSPWMTLTAGDHALVERVMGPNAYRGRTGFFTGGANGVFHLELIGEREGLLRVRNVTARAKRFVASREALIEPDFVFPFIQGRDVSEWSGRPSLHVLCPHTSASGMSPVSPAEMRERAPATYEYLVSHADVLAERRGFGGWEREMLAQAFYACQRVGDYTFADFKVVWRYIAPRFTCCVVGPEGGPGAAKPVIPNEKLMLIPCGSADEAFYVCGMLSASLVRTAIDSRLVGTQISAGVIADVAIPRYDPESPAHREVADVCRAGHRSGGLPAHQRHLDARVLDVFGQRDPERGLRAA